MNAGFIILTVTQLNTYVRSVLEADKNLSGVFVRGEISNFASHYRSGHLYMTLKDENAAVKAVMFKTSAQRLRFLPCDGMKVIAFGRVSLYDRDGQYQFYIDDLQPDGVGALSVAYEQLKEKLRREGLFDQARKKPLPRYPMRIGVVTSPAGAAVADIFSILKRRWPVAEIVFCPVAVQGDGAAAQICAAIRRLNEDAMCDVMIVGRGGGSIEDLWAFNNEELARCIASSRIPVISAVGHETDFTIADFAADLRAPTPSAAAELAAPEIVQVLADIAAMKLALQASMMNKLSQAKNRLNKALSAGALKAPAIIERQRMRLDFLGVRAKKAVNICLMQKKSAFSAVAARLDSLSPLKVLERGYAIPEGRDGRILLGAKSFAPGDGFTLRLYDGRIECQVKEKDDAAAK